MKIAFAVTEIGPGADEGDYSISLELGKALKVRYAWEIEYLTDYKYAPID